MTRVGWLDPSSGISGDMLLGACLDAGAPLALVQAAIDRLDLPESLRLEAEPVSRAGIGATWARVEAGPGQHDRRLPDILTLLERLDPPVRETASAVFQALAEAESQAHRVAVDAVHFHEVGALDSIADIVGAAAALHSLDLDRLVCAPIALGGGRAHTEHGSIPVPGPAVVELLRGRDAPAYGGPVDVELATPTGVALAVTFADAFGPMPLLTTEQVGTGAGGRDLPGHANVLRLVIGTSDDLAAPVRAERSWVLEANVDDLDPRLWPNVLTVLLDAGADDAWLTPISMKKGRPAHTVSVLCPPAQVAPLSHLLVRHTSTIGLRRHPVEKLPLPREIRTVTVAGASVQVKVARLDGAVVNVSPEYDDIARVAAATGRSEKAVLAAALHAAADLWD